MIHNMNGTFQRSRFPQILTAMQMAEDKVASISTIMRHSIRGQAFTVNAPTFASQAERTLDRYAKGRYFSEGGYQSDSGSYCLDGGRSHSSRGSPGKLGRGDRCFGCQGPHLYIRNKLIVCPNKDKPGVCEAAKANYKEWLEHCKKLNKKRKEKSLSYDKLSDKDKAKMRESILASLCISSSNEETLTVTADSSTRSPPAKKPPMTILVINLLVLLLASLLKNILLAPIVTNFPHIHIQLGLELDDPSCPVLCCVMDTATALTTGNFRFVAAIAKGYLHCITKISVPDDYNPIVLSSIVQQGGKFITTKLTVGFQFYLPYLTRDGSQTSLLIVGLQSASW